MSESMPHKSAFTIGGVGPMTWRGQDGTLHRRVVLEVRGTMVLNIDAANEFAGLLRRRSNRPVRSSDRVRVDPLFEQSPPSSWRGLCLV